MYDIFSLLAMTIMVMILGFIDHRHNVLNKSFFCSMLLTNGVFLPLLKKDSNVFTSLNNQLAEFQDFGDNINIISSVFACLDIFTWLQLDMTRASALKSQKSGKPRYKEHLKERQKSIYSSSSVRSSQYLKFETIFWKKSDYITHAKSHCIMCSQTMT